MSAYWPNDDFGNMQVELRQQSDETGTPVETTWDLFPLVEASETRHLDESGLPKPGTHIREGMILAGRIGRTREFDPDRRPSSLEVHGLPLAELRSRYGHMWRDYSVYATSETSGVVRSARFEEGPDGVTAIIELADNDNEPFTLSAAGAKETETDGD